MKFTLNWFNPKPKETPLPEPTLFPGRGIPAAATPPHVHDFQTLLPLNLLSDPRFTEASAAASFPIFILSQNWETFLGLVRVSFPTGKLSESVVDIWVNGGKLDPTEADGWLPIDGSQVPRLLAKMKELGKAPEKDWIKS